ncbi:TauD/TfdA dioxygenase family protein [Paracraurococcus lichenis]|uniref:TauD/TfdA family dioxygenase n=1 Tax=Paracraurococcus lichenis TaxID=3064888 RepID=A0ABT9E5L5_9PROT|nr:TauD/TfdA family dioxygenase [Paracraurococcus sp. LOR1-02]MDO9711463.1 TauD/TfdA family dioxygenase [Paracraurococcus sp. LOR1-02]
MTETAQPISIGLDIRPLTPTIGAEIHGITLGGTLAPNVVRGIRDAILKHKVVFFRGQQRLDEASHQAFGALLGPIEPHPTAPALDGTEYVLDIDGKRNRASAWHTDVTFVSAFPQFSVLRGVVIPPVGGDTVWANTAAAYASLPAPLRALADQLWGRFTNAYDYAGTRVTQDAAREQYHREVILSTIYESEHPIVQVHPITGERALILGHHLDRLIGFNSADSRRIVEVLQDHITREENVVRWRWQQGDVAIWDNRATQHRAVDDYGNAERIVRRVVIAGPVSVGIDGRNGVTRSSAPQAKAA